MQTSHRVVIDVEKLKSNLIPNNDIRRVVKKLLATYSEDSLPSIIETINCVSVPASDLSEMECMRILKDYTATNRNNKHPVYYLENVLERSDVKYTDYGIQVGEEKPIASKMGMLADDAMAYYAGAASTLLNFYTRETSHSINRSFAHASVATIMKIPHLDLIDIRSAIKTGLASTTLSREAHYEAIFSDPLKGLFLIDRLYSQPGLVPYTAKNAHIATVVQKYSDEKMLGHKASGQIPSVVNCDYEIKEEVALQHVWMVAAISRSQIGGEKSGIGSLTVGYGAFDMSPGYVKAIARAREIMAMAFAMDLKVIHLPTTKEFRLLVIQILVANGYVVVGNYGKGLCKKDSPPGIYASSDVSYFNVASNSLEEPTYTVTGMNWGKQDFQFCIEGIYGKTRKNVTAVLTYFTEKLCAFVEKNKNFSLYPCLTPHTGKIWLINRVIDKELTFAAHVKRFLLSVYVKNSFPLMRKPFFTVDVMRNYFPPTIILPKMITAESKSVMIITGISTKIGKVEDVVGMDKNYEIIASMPNRVKLVDIRRDHILDLCELHDEAALIDEFSAIYKEGDEDYWAQLNSLVAASKNETAQTVIKLMNTSASEVPSKESKREEKKVPPPVDDDGASFDQLAVLLSGLATKSVNT